MNMWITKLIKALKLMVFSPDKFWNRAKFYLYSLYSAPSSGEILLNGVRFQIDIDLNPEMKNMYHGLYQTEITAFLTKHLQEGDVFVDVGANIGYISAFALGRVGRTGEVHAFEPVPQYFERLRNIPADNPDHNLCVNNFALGENEGTSTIAITNLPNIGWNTMVPGLMTRSAIKEEIEIPVLRLDNYLFSRRVNDVRLIKIDTEGYEFPVLKGLERYLYNAKRLPVIIVEIDPLAYSKLNTSLRDLLQFMAKFEYIAYRIDLKRKVDITSLAATTDVVFLPKSAKKTLSGKAR